MMAILVETLIEFLDRKQHWFFLIITAVAGAMIYLAVGEGLELVQKEVSSQASLLLLGSKSLSDFVTVIVLLAVTSITFLIPRLSQKENIGFFLSKPISRSIFFYGKIFSCWAIYSGLILFCSSIIAAELSILKALPLSGSIYILAMGLAAFFVWFGIISFIGFLTKSVSAGIVALGFLWVAQLFLLGRSHWGAKLGFIQYALDFFYYILPKTSEMSGISVMLASGGSGLSYFPILTSMALAGILIYTANSLFCRQDF